jgi:hypothetical protein
MPRESLGSHAASFTVCGYNQRPAWLSNTHAERDARISATESIDAAIDRGIESVRQLDALVRNKFRDDSATLAAWTSASHTESASRAAAKPDTKPA